MSEFVKKTIVGYKAVAGGQSDPECSHVILTLKEYEDLWSDIRKAQRGEQQAKTDAAQQIARVKSEAASEAHRVAERAAERIRGVEDALAEETRQKGYQERLNANLLRIAKERANADRKLTPKKEHTGYVVMSSTEKQYKYKERRDFVAVRLWETVVQSPYSVDFTEEQAREQTKELLQDDENDLWPIQKIGISAWFRGTYEKFRASEDWQNMREHNVMLEIKYRANYKAGYWELVLTHTKALSVVPKDMRP